MKIIRFDPAPVVDKKTSSQRRMFLDEMSFSCPSCDKKSAAKFQDMIFRSVELYCKHCGAFYRVINPAFVTPPSDK